MAKSVQAMAAEPKSTPRESKLLEVPYTKRSPEQAMALYEKLRPKAEQRKGDYQTLRDAYEGNFPSDSRLKANFLKSTVDAYQSLLAFPPDIRVPPVSADEKDLKKADMHEQVLYGHWGVNGMAVKLVAAGHWLSKLGMAVFSALPDFENRRVRNELLFPDYFIPVRGRYPLSYDACFYAYKADSEEVSTTVPGDTSASADEVEIVQYWDRQVMYKWKDGKFAGGWNHDLGVVPIRAVANILVPERIEGASDIEQAIGLNEYLNELFSYEADILGFISNLPVVLKSDNTDADQVRSQWGAGAIIGIKSSDSLGFLDVPNLPSSLETQQNRTRGFLQDVTHMSDLMLNGRVNQSIATGSALARMAQPTMTIVAARQVILGAELAELNRISLMMYERFFPTDEIQLWGNRNNTLFTIKFKGRDLKGYYENAIVWQPDRMNASARDVALLQKEGRGIVSKRYVREMSGVENPTQMEEEIQREKLLEAQVQVQVETMMAQAKAQAEQAALAAGAPPGGVPAASGELQAPGQPSQGNMPEQVAKQALQIANGAGSGKEMPAGPFSASPTPVIGGQAPATGRAPATGQAPAAAQQGPVSSTQVAQAVSRVGKLRGRVWLVGAIAAQGSTTAQIDLAINQGVDKKTLIDALPQWYGRLRFQKVAGQPAGQAIEITPAALVR